MYLERCLSQEDAMKKKIQTTEKNVQKLTMKQLPKEDRPYEKCLTQGARFLTDEELLAGGIIYTAGGIIYALKLPIFNSRHRYFGSHEIFHLFVMGGSLCHYMMMYQFVA